MPLVPAMKPEASPNNGGQPAMVPAMAAKAAGEYHGAGLVPGNATGRGDTIKASVPPDSYVIPADVVAALGQGNTSAGAKVLDGIMGQNQGPPPPMAPPAPEGGIERPAFAQGGIAPPQMRPQGILPVAGPPAGIAAAQNQKPVVPIRASSGEYVVAPEACAKIGGGDLDYGHDILDNFVSTIRKDNIKNLKKLPNPKKS